MGIPRGFVISGIVLFFIAGCSGGESGADLAAVSGTVTYKNQPVANATVIFNPHTGPIATGTTGEDGKFTLTTKGKAGAAVGPGTFTVSAVDASADAGDAGEMSVEEMTKMAGEGKMDESVNKSKSRIPEKYNSKATSGLKFTVEDGKDNSFDLKLQD